MAFLAAGALLASLAASGEGPPTPRRYGKIGSVLTRLYESHLVGRYTGLPEGYRSPIGLVARDDEYVTIDAVAVDGDGEGLLQELEALGLRAGASFKHMASGRFPIARLGELAGVSKLRFAKPYYPLAYATGVQSQGDAAMHADDVRTNDGVTGAGVTVGAMSTSFNCIDPTNNTMNGPNEIGYPEDVTSMDLPSGISPLQELDNDLVTLPEFLGRCLPEGLATDEGRAMLQVVHDVAPDASLLFHSAANGQADFAQGILDLRDAGADVIVDDLGVADEPLFQDGIVSQAIDQVVADGVTYLAAGGNWANLGLDAVATGRWGSALGTTAFDWDPGAGTDYYLRFSVPAISDPADAGGLIFVLHWDQPYASATGGSGATTDLRLWLLDNGGGNVPTTLANFCETGQPAGSPDGNEDNFEADPVEVLQFVNLSGISLRCDADNVTTFNLFVEHVSGPLPDRLVLLVLAPVLGSASQFTVLDTALLPGGPTVFGHANAAKALTIGSANYDETPEFGQSPPLLAGYSSIGPGAPILFDGADNELAEPIVRAKPELVCPDGADISFNPCASYVPVFATEYLCFNAVDTDDADSFPNFFGTSAAAAHCAGGAALLLEKEPAQFPVDVYQALVTGAIDMDDPGTGGFDTGFDVATGWGLVQLDAASASLDCGDPDGFNLILTSGSEAGNPVTRESCNAIYASGFTIETAADVTFQAGNRIVLGDGFTVESGADFAALLN